MVFDAVDVDVFDEGAQDLAALGWGGLGQALGELAEALGEQGRVEVLDGGGGLKLGDLLTGVELFIFEGGKSTEEGFAVAAAFGDGVGHILNLAAKFFEFLLGEFALGEELVLFFVLGELLGAEELDELFGMGKLGLQLIEDACFEGGGGQAREVAIAAAHLAGTGVGGVGFAIALVGGVDVEWGATAGAEEQATEEVVAGLTAGMGEGIGGDVALVGVAVLDELDLIPDLAGDNGAAVVFDGEVAEFENAEVEPVVEEGAVGVEGAVEAGGGVDLEQGFARGAHFEGLADSGDELGVGDPAVGDVGGAVAALANVDGFALEADRRDARDAAVLQDEVAQASAGVGGGLTALLFVGDIDEEFDDAAVLALGDGVGEGVDGDLSITEEGFVVDGVIEVAGKAGVVPEQETMRSLDGGTVEIEHAVEVFTPDGGTARAGHVDKVVTQDQAVGGAIGLDLDQLLFGGLILARATTIAAIGIDDGARGKGGRRGEVGHEIILKVRLFL